jgi:hypothetical protein
MDQTTSTTDATALIDRLDTDAIQRELADLDCRVRSLRVLLRAALARRRQIDVRVAHSEEARCGR